jgi:hypothetical protein
MIAKYGTPVVASTLIHIRANRKTGTTSMHLRTAIRTAIAVNPGTLQPGRALEMEFQAPSLWRLPWHALRLRALEMYGEHHALKNARHAMHTGQTKVR